MLGFHFFRVVQTTLVRALNIIFVFASKLFQVGQILGDTACGFAW
jgi:hypothetical protein